MNDIVCLLVNIYGFNSNSENNQLLDIIEDKLSFYTTKFPGSNVLIGGDFNVVMDPSVDRWPPAQPLKSISKLQLLISRFDLYDIWRSKFPNDKKYTWSNKDGSRQSRIDFWLTPNILEKEKIEVHILTTPLTDHKALSMKINFIPDESNLGKSSYWKMNSSLLNHKCVKTEIETCSNLLG